MRVVEYVRCESEIVLLVSGRPYCLFIFYLLIYCCEMLIYSLIFVTDEENSFVLAMALLGIFFNDSC